MPSLKRSGRWASMKIQRKYYQYVLKRDGDNCYNSLNVLSAR